VGPTVLVTRPAAQAGAWVQRLRDAGVDAHALPLLAIEPADAPAERAALEQAWRSLPDRALAMFVSPNAVDGFFGARPDGLQWPDGLRAGATGPGTVESLQRAGVPAAACVAPAAPPYDSARLWAQLRGERWAGRSVLVVRGDGGRDEFALSLREAGADVDFVQAYRRDLPRWSAAERALADAALAAPKRHVWLFSSGEAVGHLARLLPGARWHQARALASHERIAARARAAGFGVVAEAPPTIEAVLTALQRLEGPAP
jgi:uroporphyrinogen-III synthase